MKLPNAAALAPVAISAPDVSRNTKRNRFHLTTISALLCVCLWLRGCTQNWFLQLVDAKDPQHPTFCITSKPACGGLPFTGATISVYRLDKGSTGTVWDSRPVENNNPITTFTYGVDPPGWKSDIGPKPLESRAHYEVENSVFTCEGTAPQGTCSVLTGQEYWDMVHTNGSWGDRQ